jgi:uncharacterized protein with PQ loop repeat
MLPQTVKSKKFKHIKALFAVALCSITNNSGVDLCYSVMREYISKRTTEYYDISNAITLHWARITFTNLQLFTYALNNIHSHSVEEKNPLQIHNLVSGHLTIVLIVLPSQ